MTVSEEPNVEIVEAGATGADEASVALEGAEQEAGSVAEGEAEQLAEEGEGEGEEPQAVDLSGIDLTELPQFRDWQSQQDRQLAEARRQSQELQAQMQQTMRQLEAERDEVRLLNADPNQQAAFYKTKLSQERAAMQQREQQQALTSAVNAKAFQMVADAGLDPKDPNLDWTGGATYQGLAMLAESVTRAQRLKMDKDKTEAAQMAKKKAKRAVKATGAAKPNLATGSGKKSLMQEYRAELDKLRGSGKLYEFQKLQRKYKAKGLEV
jgi:hypothetical protein